MIYFLIQYKKIIPGFFDQQTHQILIIDVFKVVVLESTH